MNDDLNLSTDMFPHNLSTILHIDNPLGESNMKYLEVAAFEKQSNGSLRGVGSCSGFVDIIDDCIMRFSYRGIQFQYSLYRNQISRDTYEKITLLLKTKIDSWLVN